ncbi:hypothetical protein RB600_001864 [Gaeumannomyces tritici]
MESSRQYTEEDVERAFAAVRTRGGIRRAARLYGIPEATLRKRIKGALPIRQSQEGYQRIPPEQEKRLANWILLQDSLGLPPTHAEIRFFAEEILRLGGDSQPLGKHWIRAFLGRYPEIRTGRSKRIKNARVQGATTGTITEWWQRLQIPEVARIKPENTYNADEGGLQEGRTGNGLVLGLAGTRPLQRKEPGFRTWTSFIECISATGVSLPPLIIFKGKSVQEQWFPADLGPFRGWEFTATDNGWTTDFTGLEWLQKVFLPRTQPLTPEARLLILDGHGSHVTKEFMSLCLRNNVFLLYLPAHTSHVLQPLDLSIFSPLKQAYRQKIGFQALFTCSTVVGKRQFLTAYAHARSEALIALNIKAGWRASGLWPRNIAKPLMSRFVLNNFSLDSQRSEIQQAAEDNRAKRRSTILSQASQVPWETPKRSRKLATQISFIQARIPASPTTRLFFRKLQKSYSTREYDLATAHQKIRQLEAQLEAQRPCKRRRVATDPNETFVDIRRVAETRGAVEEEMDAAFESPENSDQELALSCIEVA